MIFKALSLLCLAATAVQAGALIKKDCVDYVGNSWGCAAPPGTGATNYCTAVDASRPTCTSYIDGGLYSAQCCS